MAATRVAWFAGNFATADLGPLDWLAGHALYLYRGPLSSLSSPTRADAWRAASSGRPWFLDTSPRS